MNDRFDQPQRPWWRASQNEEYHAAISNFEQRQREFDRRRREQQEREALLRQQHGAELAKMIETASEVVGVQDGEVKAIALDLLVERIAKREVQPSQLSPKDYRALCYQSIHDAGDLQREQLSRETAQGAEQLLEEQPRRKYDPRSHYYAELQETHLKVSEELKLTNADPVQQPHEAIGNEGADRDHSGRYAELEETHDRVRIERSQRDESTERQTAEMEQAVRGLAQSDGDAVEPSSEQPDSKREATDKAQRREALMQQFSRSTEETVHRELTQDGGQGRD